MLFLPEQKIARKEHLFSMAVPARPGIFTGCDARRFSQPARRRETRDRAGVVNGVMARRRLDQNPPQYGGTP
jgi:hypothetical protein